MSFAYEGAFRVPQGSDDQNSFEYGGSALVFDAARRSLWMVGHDHHQRVAELSIPEIRTAASIDHLDTAQLLTPFDDILRGRRAQIGDADSKIGGLLKHGADWVVSAWVYYDASNSQSRSHFRVKGDRNVSGPFQLGPASQRAGFVSGYMADIPPEWQSRFGGRALAGQCCVPIISRTSLGPSASVFDPGDLGVRNPVPAELLLGYPIDHPTLGRWDDGPGLFNGNTQITGVVFPSQTDSIVFFGRVGLGRFCYGTGTGDASQDGRPTPGGSTYCYDPTSEDQGSHGYPYAFHFWAYDANDLAAVKVGASAAWDLRPYHAGVLNLPFEQEYKAVGGVAYDPSTGRIFVSALYQDGIRPLIHVLRLDAPPAIPPGEGEGTPDLPGSATPRPTDGPPVGRARPR